MNRQSIKRFVVVGLTALTLATGSGLVAGPRTAAAAPLTMQPEMGFSLVYLLYARLTLWQHAHTYYYTPQTSLASYEKHVAHHREHDAQCARDAQARGGRAEFRSELGWNSPGSYAQYTYICEAVIPRFSLVSLIRYVQR